MGDKTKSLGHHVRSEQGEEWKCRETNPYNLGKTKHVYSLHLVQSVCGIREVWFTWKKPVDTHHKLC